MDLLTNKNIKNHYLYRHIRDDNNEPFYIGVGTKRGNSYPRANSTMNRNRWWRFIVEKTTFTIEIIFESSNYQEILDKEIEFIKLYGRKDLKEGQLVNLTDGGEGSLGAIVKDSTRKLHSKRSKGNTYRLNTKQSTSTRNRMSEDRKGSKHPMFGKKHKPETIEKFRIAQTGSKKSEETKEKHRKRSKLPGQCNRKPCALVDNETSKKWEAISVLELSRKTPISLSTIKKLKKNIPVNKRNNKYKFIQL